MTAIDSIRSPLTRRRFVWIPVALFVVLTVAVLIVWQLYRAEVARAKRQETALLTEQLAQRLQEFIRARLSLLELVRDERLAGLMADRSSFREQTAHLRRQFGGFHAINWIDADGVIRWVSPEEGNREAVGRNVFEHELAESYLRSSRDTGAPRMTRPLDLFQGGRAFTTYFPERDSRGAISGYVNGVFLIGPLVRGCLGDTVLESYHVEIRDGDHPVYSTAASPSPDSDALRSRAAVHVLDREWSFLLAPKSGGQGLAGGWHLWILFGGLSLSAAIAFALWLTFAYLEHERRRVEARNELESQLHRSQKMEAIGQLAGGVAHDFNNLLTVIIGNASIVSDSADLTDTDRASLAQVISASERAGSLTKRLLSFARQQVVQPQRLHLNAEIRELQPMLERLVRADIRVHFDLRAEQDTIEMDPGQVSQVLLNLVSNSVDAMPAGGRLSVATHDGDGHLVLTVSDSGEGMDAETQARALEPFYTTKPVGRGTGLGLSTVYGEVSNANGQVELRSRVGEGTTVEVRLPLATAEAPTEARDETRPAIDASDVHCRVLIVDDEPDVRDVARLILEGAGFQVVCARDGVEALELASKQPRFGVVVTDSVMPKVGGVELVRELRAKDPNLSAVIMSGYSQDLLEVPPSKLGALFLAKPFTTDALLEVVRRAILESRSSSSKC